MHRLSYPPAPQQARALDGGQASYNQLVERLVAYRALLEEHDAVDNPAAVPTSSLALPRPSDDQAAQRRHWLLRDGPVIEEFLATTAGQLTVCGLAQLHEEMGEGELAALFRNNHFSVLHKRSGRLFMLASDEGFLHEPHAVWERLDEPTGNVEYVDGFFRPLALPHATSHFLPRAAAAATVTAAAPPAVAAATAATTPQPPAVPAAAAAAAAAAVSSPEEAADRLLALQLQQDQEAAASEGRRAFEREGVQALLTEGGPLELLRAQDPAAPAPAPAPVPGPTSVASEDEEGAMVEGGFYLVPGSTEGARTAADDGAAAAAAAAPLLVDPETQRPFSPDELAAMRAAEEQFRCVRGGLVFWGVLKQLAADDNLACLYDAGGQRKRRTSSNSSGSTGRQRTRAGASPPPATRNMYRRRSETALVSSSSGGGVVAVGGARASAQHHVL